MKRVSTIKVKYDCGSTVKVTVETVGKDLMRDEQQYQHDKSVDNCINAVRDLPYLGTAPLRNIKIS